MKDVLTRSQLKRLVEHKYNVAGVSLAEPLFQSFWQWIVDRIPDWWAPNALTLAGLIINVVTTVILMLFSADAVAEPHFWSFFLCSAGLFVYMTLDAIDGKQARKTNSSSPLGELFDHGCDAVSIAFIVCGMCIAMQLGQSPRLMLFECFGTLFVFYTAHWQAYCSGQLRFGRIDVTEAEISIILLHLLTGFLGPSFWSTELPWIGMELKVILATYSITGAIVSLCSNFNIILMEGGIGRNGSTVAGTSVLSPFIPIGILIALAVTIWTKSITRVFQQNFVLYIISFGIASSKVSIRLVVAHMSRTEMDMLDSSLFGPGLLFLNQYFNTFFNELIVLWIFFIVCLTDLILYSVRLCLQMSNYMDISVFSIVPPKAIASTNVSDGIADKQKPINCSVANVRKSRDDSGTASSHSRSSSSSSCDTTTRLPSCAAVRARNTQRCS